MITLQFLAVYLVILNDPRLEFIALCVLCAFALFSTAIMTLANALEQPVLARLFSAAKNQMPFLSILTAIWLQRYAYPVDVYAVSLPLFMSCILGLVVSLTVSLPFVVWSNKNAPILTLLLDGFLDKIKPIMIRA